MRHLVFYLGFFVICTFSLIAAPVPRGDATDWLYYSTVEGSRWEYKCQGREPDLLDIRVGKVERFNGGFTVYTNRFDGGGLTPWEKVKLTPKELLLIERGGQAYSPPVPLLRFPLKTGNKWETETFFCNSKLVIRCVVGKMKLIHVGAGKFKAISVTVSTDTGSGQEQSVPETYWYALGVGRILCETPAGYSEKMSRFCSGK